ELRALRLGTGSSPHLRLLEPQISTQSIGSRGFPYVAPRLRSGKCAPPSAPTARGPCPESAHHPAAALGTEPDVLEAEVGPVEGMAGRDDLVDGVEGLRRELHVCSAQELLELGRRAGTDDGRRDGG